MFMSNLFLELFNRAVAAGWLVLAVCLLRLVLKRAPRWIHCSLWALVGLRLVWPFSLESALSLLPSREVLPPAVLFDPTPAVQTGIEAVNTAINGSFTPAMTAMPGTSVNPLQIWTWLAGWLWAVGAAVLLGYAMFSYVRLRNRVAVCVEEGGLYRCDGVGSPFILGMFRPKIYVPSDLDPQTLPYVLAHEQAHLRRKDHWWKPLGYLLLTVFWFHPLLWAAYILLCRDIECACDERVVRTLDSAGRKAYSMALVDCAADRRSIAACPVAFGESGVKQRVWSVLHYKKPGFWVVVLAVILSVAAAVCFLTDPVGFRLEFAAEDIAKAVTMDLRMNAGPVTGELNKAQQEELWFRLRDLKNTRKRDAYGGLTPFYSLSIQLADGSWVRIQGYALDGSMVDLVQGDEVFRVDDPEFQNYLNRLCAGGTTAPAVDAEHPPLELRFEIDCDELRLSCEQGQLDRSDPSGAIWWIPLNEDGTPAASADVAFELWKEDAILAEGTLTVDTRGNCGISISGSPNGAISVLDADGSLLFVASLPAAGPPPAPEVSADPTVYQSIADLQPGDLTGVNLHNDPDSIDLEHLRQMLREAAKEPINGQVQPYVGWEIQITLADAPVLTLLAGTVENQVEIRQEDQWMCVSNEELYRIVRTCNDVPHAGIDPKGYALCRELVDGHLQYIPDLPAGMKKEQITKELTGFVLHDQSETLHAQAWRMDVAWNVDPPEQAYILCAGSSCLNSDLQLLGANASETYVIVIDGEPVGFVGWWFLMDQTLDQRFDTKEDLLAAVLNDG